MNIKDGKILATEREIKILEGILDNSRCHRLAFRLVKEAEEILNLMPIGQPVRAMEIALKTDSWACGGLTCQKTSSLLKILIRSGLVKREEIDNGLIEVEGTHWDKEKERLYYGVKPIKTHITLFTRIN